MSTLSGPPVGSTPDAQGSEQTFVGGKRQSPHDARIEQAPFSKSKSISASSKQPNVSNASTANATGNRYEEKEEIGRGGCGVVLRAYDRLMQRDVVIKRVLDGSKNTKETVARFLNEARITGRLEHPGIVPVHEIGQADLDGIPYYVMKWLHGVTLKEAINEYQSTNKVAEKHRKFHELLIRFRQVCQTLAYAHEQKVIHRDLKPANIMVGSFGETIVLDWGLAKDLTPTPSSAIQQDSSGGPSDEATINASIPEEVADRDSNRNARSLARDSKFNHNGLTQFGTVMGTAAYMSPEQARGESGLIDSRSDIFSLGVILYEILAGVSPFRSNSVQTTLKLVSTADFKRPRKLNRHVPIALDAICSKAMQLTPEDRYQRAEQLAEDINNYLSGHAVTAYREPWWRKIDRVASNHRTLVRSTFAGLFAIAMLSILGAARIEVSRRAEKTARMHAEQETQEKVLAHQREQVAHSRSLTQLQAARRSVDAWLIDLSGDLQYYPGLASIRLELLNKAQQYYQKSSESANDSVPEVLETARNNLRLGDIARLSGSILEARNRYEEAEKMLVRIQSEAGVPEDTFATQYANALLGLSLCSLEETAVEDAGIRLAEKAADSAMRARTIAPEDLDARKTWIRTIQCLARHYEKSGLSARGSELLKKPIAMAELLYIDERNSNAFHLLTNLVSDQSRMLETAGQIEAAIEGYQRLIQAYSQQLRSTEQRPDWLEQRANAHTRLGNCYTQILKDQAAVLEYETAESDMQKAWAMLYEDTYFLENFAISTANLGKALYTTGDREQAEAALRTSIARMHEVIQKNGSTPNRVHRMVSLFLSLASTMEDQSSDDFVKLVSDSRKLLKHLAIEKSNSVKLIALNAQCSLLEASIAANGRAWLEAARQCDLAIKQVQSEAKMVAISDPTILLLKANLLELQSQCQCKLGLLDDAKANWREALVTFSECTESSALETSVAAEIGIIQSLCESELASSEDYTKAFAHSQRLIEVAGKNASQWHWRAIAAWRNNRIDVAMEAIANAKQLRAKPALEDELLEVLLARTDAKKDAAFANRLEKLKEKEVARSRHISFLLQEIFKTRD